MKKQNRIQELVEFTDAKESDLNFILNSWLKSFESFRVTHVLNVPVAKSDYFLYVGEHIKKTLIDNNTIIVRDRRDPNSVLGYVVASFKTDGDMPGMLHYIYVKQPYRAMGVASDLLSRAVDFNKPVIATCLTASGKKLLKATELAWSVVPFI